MTWRLRCYREQLGLVGRGRCRLHLSVELAGVARLATHDRCCASADAVKLAQAIGADEGIVADGKQVDQVLDLTDGTGAGVIVDFQTAFDDLDAAYPRPPQMGGDASMKVLRCRNLCGRPRGSVDLQRSARAPGARTPAQTS